MKYTKKTLAVLTSDLRALVDQGFRFELSQKEIFVTYDQFLKQHFETDTGKKRYPDYYKIALNAFFNEFMTVRISENLIWCYLIDGQLYHGTKKAVVSTYYKGDTIKFPNYRDFPEIEKKLFSNQCTDRGFFYNSGKKYH